MPLMHCLEVISRDRFEEIHQASLKVLSETGIQFHCNEAIEMFKKNGAKVDGETVFITGDMVADALATCPKSFTWTARNPARTITVGDRAGAGFLVQPDVGPVFVQDTDRGRRMATLRDYADVIRICQAGENIHLNGTIPVDPSDVDPQKKHLHMMYEILKNSDKPILGFCFDMEQVEEDIKMVEMAFGGGDFLETHHCMGFVANPLTPLGFSPETIESIMAYAKHNQVVMLAPCIMAGISGPISLLGTSLLQNIEFLAGLVLVQMTRPGAPVIYAAASTTGYMQVGSYAAGTPEAMLINTPNIQMANEYYHLPSRTMCGISHSKEIDCQAGYETMMSLMLGVLSGAHMGVQCVGTLDAIMTLSLEKMIIDQELISMVLRVQKGVEAGPGAVDAQAKIIQEVGCGGTFLTHLSTFKECRNLWNPTLGDWQSYDVWSAAGSESIVAKANKKFKSILADAPESFLDKQLDADLSKFINALA